MHSKLLFRWVLVDGYGCQECDECVHDLLDTTDELAQLIRPTIDEFEVILVEYLPYEICRKNAYSPACLLFGSKEITNF